MRCFYCCLQALAFLVAAFILAAGCICPRALAQTTSGSIYGTMTDPAGGVIPGVAVTATDTRTGVTSTTTTNATGDYLFPVLPPSDYKLTAQVSGFQSQTQSGIRLDANQSVHVNFKLAIGSTTQEITVEATTTLVDTRESQIGETIDQKRIAEMPLNGRNAYDLVQILPGVSNYTADVATGSRQGAQLTINGVPAYNTSYYLDGSYDTNLWRFGGNLLPNPDALQEFRVLTSNYDAEFGRSAGGVVSAITASGSSSYHGLLYEYLRNDILNAKNYLLTSVTPLRQNQYGGDVGGPVPHISRSFFFLSYQGMRVRTPTNITSGSVATPTAAIANGDFSALASKYWPKQANGTYYSCNGVTGAICPSLLDPVAQNLLKYVPLADSTTGITPQQSGNGNLSADQGLARVDFQGAKHQIAVMFFESRGTSNNPTAGSNQILSYAGMNNYEGQYNSVVSHTWLISPTKVNNLRLYYSLNHYIIANIYGQQHMLKDLGSQAAEGGNYNAQPYFSITGYWTMGTNNAGPNNLPSTTLGASDTFRMTWKKHEIKFGGAYNWDHFASTGGASSNGIFTFTGSTTGNAEADFLLGKANTLTQNNGVFFRSHSQDPALFVADNWRVTSRLALNYGMRWEYFPMYTGQNNTATFIPNKQSIRFPNAPLGLLSSGDSDIPDGIMHTPYDTFAPRFGFAYDVFGTGSTSVRGSYGLFYSAIDQVAVSNNLVQQPFSRTVTVNKTPNLVTPFSPSADPFPYTFNSSNAVFLSGTTIYGLLPGYKSIPYVHEYSLGIQQQYGAKWSSEINYIGNVGHRFPITVDANSPIYAPNGQTTTAGLNARRPYEPTPSTYTFGTISQVQPYSDTSYNSLQATLTRRFDRRFSLMASYVWSKATAYGAVVNSYNVRSSRGLADIDQPQQFVVSYIYVIPDVRKFGILGKEVLSGWQFNGITSVDSGQPFNVTSGTDTNLDGVNNDRPNIVANPNLPGGRSRAQRIAAQFNTAAFKAVPANTPYGNSPYNPVLGPAYFNTDLSAFKSFPVVREMNVQFRADAFNVFNNVNFNSPNGVLSSPKFGTISTAKSPRILQFALRISF